MKYGHVAVTPGREFTGGFADFCMLAPGTGIVRVPDSLPDAVAAPANCAVATVAAACRLAGPLDGAVVAVIGCGVLGRYACAMARALGAAQVIGCDLAGDRRDRTLAFGAGYFVNPDGLVALCQSLTGGRGADVAFELSGASSAVALAIKALRTGGTAVIAGTTTPCPPVELNPHLMMRRMLTLRGLHNYAPRDLVAAIDFLAEHARRLPLESLDGGRFRLEEIDAAFREASNMPGTRVAVVP
jgi:alcohol dehydrogenase